MFMPDEFFQLTLKEIENTRKELNIRSNQSKIKPIRRKPNKINKPSDYTKPNNKPKVEAVVNKPVPQTKVKEDVVIDGINVQDALNLLNNPVSRSKAPKRPVQPTSIIKPTFLKLTKEEVDLSNQIFQLSIDKIRGILPKLRQSVVESLRQLAICVVEYDMDMYTYDYLISQTYHESYLVYNKVESFRYSKSRMVHIFGKYHPDVKKHPRRYIGNPVALANYVYANRMGNGSVKSGDGWKYRGRGLTQLTGKEQYNVMTKLYNKRYGTKLDFVKNPDLVLTPNISARIVFLYWYKKNIPNVIANAYNKGADNYTINEAVTKIINGGRNGLDERYKALIALQTVTYDDSILT